MNIVNRLYEENSKALGKWILRDLFKLKDCELVTNEILELYGIDSVRIDKIDDLEYEISFANIGSYEKFIENSK
ncbi:MAG: hypothetical protein U9O24_04690 [Campylobacterota bacterium]|nr:hypothetical protein [Campylobacterota bacterium]